MSSIFNILIIATVFVPLFLYPAHSSAEEKKVDIWPGPVTAESCHKGNDNFGCIYSTTLVAAYLEGIITQEEADALEFQGDGQAGQICSGDVLAVNSVWKDGHQTHLFEQRVSFDGDVLREAQVPHHLDGNSRLCLDAKYWEIERPDGITVRLYVPDYGSNPMIIVDSK